MLHPGRPCRGRDGHASLHRTGEVHPADLGDHCAALDALGDAQHRSVHELFWWWDSPDATCSCVSSLHRDHDAAVRAHVKALDLELPDEGGHSPSSGQPNRRCPCGSGRMLVDCRMACRATARPDARHEQWVDAAARWSALLRRAAFWDHIRHRIEILDDRRLDEDTIDALRDALPRALVTTVVDLAAAAPEPARLAAHARRWDVGPDVVDDVLTETAAPTLERVRALCSVARRQFNQGQPHDAASGLFIEAVPLLDWLEGLVPHQDSRTTATARDEVATLLNNSALAMPGYRVSPVDTAYARSWLDVALRLTVDPSQRQIIADNRAEVDVPASAGPGPAPAGSEEPMTIGQFVGTGVFLAVLLYLFGGSIANGVVVGAVIAGVLSLLLILGIVGNIILWLRR